MSEVYNPDRFIKAARETEKAVYSDTTNLKNIITALEKSDKAERLTELLCTAPNLGINQIDEAADIILAALGRNRTGKYARALKSYIRKSKSVKIARDMYHEL